MPTLRNQIKLALAYFLLAAILGLFLRAFFTGEIAINYKFILHTHSHIALLGWVYLALTTLLYKLFLGTLEQDTKYSNIFWFTQASLLGMLLTFPFQGYALLSIIFSTLFLFASYWFTVFFLKNTPIGLRKTNSFKCIRASLFYLVFSSIGPWALGAIMNILGPESVWYRLAIYFYLHFLYNGWMIMALIGLALYVIEQHQIGISDRVFGRFYWSINLAIFLSFFLSTLFATPPLMFYIVGGVGALLQLVAFGILAKGLAAVIKDKEKILGHFQIVLLKNRSDIVAAQITASNPNSLSLFCQSGGFLSRLHHRLSSLDISWRYYDWHFSTARYFWSDHYVQKGNTDLFVRLFSFPNYSFSTGEQPPG